MASLWEKVTAQAKTGTGGEKGQRTNSKVEGYVVLFCFPSRGVS